MSPFHAVAIFAAGIVAGTINTVVGSGTLITFPVLLGFGYAPVVANVSNTVGLIPGFVTGTLGYRRELSGQRARITSLAGASVTGGAIGAVLLLSLPASAFEAVVPAFIAIAVALIVLQPRLSRLLGNRRSRTRGRLGPIATLAVMLGGVYGGYFGAAQGILVLAILILALDDDLQRLNAVKVVLTGLVNVVSGVVFILAAHVAWAPAGLIAGGSLIGGVLGARVGRRLSLPVLRAVIVVIGIAAIVHLLA
ncbi:MAG: sulfite exporter TauE/SafE family protein [Solirubrobacteraceae bacterium]